MQIEKRLEIIRLINEGVSIPKISKRLQIGKSTIYYHYKKIKGRKIQLIKIPNDPKVLGEFLGAFSGDGSFCYQRKTWHYTIRFHLHRFDDAQYADYLTKLVESNFGKKMSISYVEPNASILKIHSKEIYKLIKEYLVILPSKSLSVSLKKPLEDLSDEFLSSFVRGVVDTDGSVDKHGRIILGLISHDLISQISLILERFGIEHRCTVRKTKPEWHNLHIITINKEPSKIYLQKIGFSNKRKEKRMR